MNEPQDLRSGWLNVARRLQSAARSMGCSTVSITVVCDEEGNPILWTEPTQTKLEPKALDKDKVTRVLTQGPCPKGCA